MIWMIIWCLVIQIAKMKMNYIHPEILNLKTQVKNMIKTRRQVNHRWFPQQNFKKIKYLIWISLKITMIGSPPVHHLRVQANWYGLAKEMKRVNFQNQTTMIAYWEVVNNSIWLKDRFKSSNLKHHLSDRLLPLNYPHYILQLLLTYKSTTQNSKMNTVIMIHLIIYNTKVSPFYNKNKLDWQSKNQPYVAI